MCRDVIHRSLETKLQEEFAIAITLAALAALFMVHAPAQAGTRSSVTLPETFEILDVCTREFVQFMGTVTIIADTTVNGNNMNVQVRITENLTGVGETSGDNYSVNSKENQAAHVSSTDGGRVNVSAEVVVLGPGGVANEPFHTNFRATLDNQGDIVNVTVDRETGRCVG